MQLPDVVTTDDERAGNGQTGLDFVRPQWTNIPYYRTIFPRVGRSKNPCPLFRAEIHVSNSNGMTHAIGGRHQGWTEVGPASACNEFTSACHNAVETGEGYKTMLRSATASSEPISIGLSRQRTPGAAPA